MDATMDALVVESPGRFEVREVEVPRPGRLEVLSRVRAVAICGTDPHIIKGDFPGFWPKAFPFIPGHEWSGDVMAVGEGAEHFGWAVGIGCPAPPTPAAASAAKCVEGRYNICENYGRESVHRQYGHYTQGCYATYVVHSIKSIVQDHERTGGSRP